MASLVLMFFLLRTVCSFAAPAAAQELYRDAVNLVEKGLTSEALITYRRACLEDESIAQFKDYGLSGLVLENLEDSGSCYEWAKLLLMFGHAEKAIPHLERTIAQFSAGSDEHTWAVTRLNALNAARDSLIPKMEATDEVKGRSWDEKPSASVETPFRPPEYSIEVMSFDEKLQLLTKKRDEAVKDLIRMQETLSVMQARYEEKKAVLEDYRNRFDEMPEDAPMKDYFRKTLEANDLNLEKALVRINELRKKITKEKSYIQQADSVLESIPGYSESRPDGAD